MFVQMSFMKASLLQKSKNFSCGSSGTGTRYPLLVVLGQVNRRRRLMYYIYMLRCEDNSIYTGITTNVEHRMKEHFGKKNCAKYTYSHTAKKLECVWQTDNRVLASKLEYQIKKLKKIQKEELIVKNNLEKFLYEKIDCSQYKRLE